MVVENSNSTQVRQQYLVCKLHKVSIENTYFLWLCAKGGVPNLPTHGFR